VTDWLDDGADARIEQHNKALDFAKLYVAVFVNNEAGRELLQHWSQHYARKRTPMNAPHTEYAANEALRAFVQGIEDQIRFASSRGG
jgi:hypothetical protein